MARGFGWAGLVFIVFAFATAPSLVAQIAISSQSQKLDLIGPKTKFIQLPVSVQAERVLSGEFDQDMEYISRQSFGFSDEAVWLQFELENVEAEALELTLSFAYRLLNYVNIFESRDGGDWTKHAIGALLPSVGGSPASELAHQFRLEPNQRVRYLIQISSASSLQVTAYVSNIDVYQYDQVINMAIYAIFIGAFLGLALYNLFLFVVTGFMHYLTYSLLAATSILREAYLSGMLYQLMFHQSPALNEAIGMCGLAINITFANIFVMTFLQVRKNSKASYYFLLISSCVSISYVPLYFLQGYSFVIKPFTLQVFVTAISCVIVSIVRYRQGFATAKHFIFAFWFALMGWAVSALAVAGVMDPTMLTKFGSAAGQFIEMVLLSFALSAYINQIKKEKNAAVVQLNRVLEASVKEKSEDIRVIMKHIPEGICLVRGDDLKISRDYSEYLESVVLTKDLVGKSLIELAFKNSNLDANTVDQAQAAIQACLDEPPLAFEVNRHLLIKEFERPSHDGEMEIFVVDWNPVISDEGLTKEILVVIKNETKLRQYQKEVRRKQRELKMLDELVQIPPGKFVSFVNSCENLLLQTEKVTIEKRNLGVDQINLLMRTMHTLKGLARSLNLSELANAAHESETFFQSIARREKKINPKDLRQEIDGFRQILQRYVDFSRRKLGRFDFNHEEEVLKFKNLEVLIAEITSLKEKFLSAPDQARLYRIKNFLIESLGNRLEDVLEEQIGSLQSIAAQLGKETPKVRVHAPYFIAFQPVSHQLLTSVFTHLFRNALDHGLEEAAAREIQGKDPCGQITIELEHTEDQLKICFSDDGAGLNLNRIRERAIELGLVDDAANPAAQDLAELIFRNGFTTSDSVTEVSGRGVGMDAVRSFLEENGGSIEIELMSAQQRFSGTPFRFHIRLPAQFAWVDPKWSANPKQAKVIDF